MKRLFFFIIFFFSTASVAEAQWALVFPNFVPPIQHSNKSGGIFYTNGMLWACGGSNVPPIILY